MEGITFCVYEKMRKSSPSISPRSLPFLVETINIGGEPGGTGKKFDRNVRHIYQL